MPVDGMGGGAGDGLDGIDAFGGDEVEGAEAGEEQGAAAGGEEPSELQRLLAERGLDEKSAARLLADRADEAEQERAQEQAATVQARAQEMLNQQFPDLFANYLSQQMTDPRFRASVMRRYGLAPTMPGGGGGEQGGEPIDPTTRMVQDMVGRVRALEERNQALEQRLAAGAEQDLSSQRYHNQVSDVIDRFFERYPEAQEFAKDMLDDLVYRSKNGPRFQNPQMEVKRFLSDRFGRYADIKKRLTTPQGSAVRTTRPARANAGARPGTARPGREDGELSLRSITADVVADVLDARGRAQ